MVSLERGGPERGPGASVSGRGTPTLSKHPTSAEHARAAQSKEELTCAEGWGHPEAQEVLEDGQAHEEAAVARPHLSDGLAPPKAQKIQQPDAMDHGVEVHASPHGVQNHQEAQLRAGHMHCRHMLAQNSPHPYPREGIGCRLQALCWL